MSTRNEHHHDDFRHRIREALQLLERRWKAAFVPFCLVTSLALWASHYLPRTYRATTTFERRDDPVLSNLIHERSPYSFDKLRRSLIMDMTGTRAMADVAARLGLGGHPNEITVESEEQQRHRLAAAARGAVKTYNVHILQSSDSLDVIQVEVVADSPQMAEKFSVAMRESYVDFARSRINDILHRTKDFFEQERLTRLEELAETYDDMAAMLIDFPGIDPRRPSSVGERMEALREDRDRFQREIAQLENEIQVRETFLDSAPTQATKVPEWLAKEALIAADPVAGDPAIRAQIHALQGQRSDLQTLNGMTAQHPSVVAIDRKIAHLNDRLQASILNDAMVAGQAGDLTGELTEPMRIWLEQKSRVDLELQTRRRKLSLNQEALAGVQTKLNRFEGLYDNLIASHGDLETRAAQIKQGEADAATWSGYLMQLNRILAAESSQRGVTFASIEEPKNVGRPVSPTMRSVTSTSIALGLVAGCLFLLLFEVFDRSFKTATQVSRTLGIAVLEGIGEIVTPSVRRERVLKRAFWTPLVVMLLLVVVGVFGLTYLQMERPDLYKHVSARAAEAVGASPARILWTGVFVD